MLRFFIWPYYKLIQEQLFNKEYRKNKSITFKIKKFNPVRKQENLKSNFYHYFIMDKDGNYIIYNDQISSLILSDKLPRFKDGLTLFDKGMKRINDFFDNVYIDEFQDYRKDKYKLMVKIMQNVSNGIMYGDYYQHSVSGLSNNGAPFLSKTTYDSFIKEMIKNGFEIDNKTLLKTRRCSENVCKFIREKLNIEIYSDDEMNRIGNITYIFDNKQLENVLKNKKVKILSLTNSSEWKSISFGLSKGNTYDNTLVIIPDKYLINENEGLKPIDNVISKNQIYVALTRATGETYVTSRSFVKKHFTEV